MITGIIATKVVVRDLGLAEQFYAALGLAVVSRNLGGEDDVRQEQVWLSVGGDPAAHIVILSHFTEVPAPAPPAYPREFWFAFRVDDVDATARAAEAAGGGVLRAGEDRPEHRVRAGLITDPDGHIIEIVGPMQGSKA